MNQTPATEVAIRLPRLAKLIIVASLALITLRLCMFHVYFDQHDKRDDKFIQGREAATGMHCANDRSRWASVAALVHYHTFSIDDIDTRRGKEGNWGTIDKVYHADREGVERFYSSKPPLYSIILAAQYWLLHESTGLNIFESPRLTIKILTFVNQVLLFAAILFLLARFAQERLKNSPQFYLYLIAIGFGTFLSTFAVSLNNHIPAALFTLLAIIQCHHISKSKDTPWYRFSLIGLYTAMTVTFELPALAFLCLVGLWSLTIDFRRTILYGVPPILFVGALYLGVTLIAHGSWRPPYAHRSDGPVLEVLDLQAGDTLVSGVLPDNLDLFSETMPGMGDFRVEAHPQPGRWRIYDYRNNVRYALVRNDTTYEIRAWDNWYDYEVNGRKSYWLPGQASGVDLGEPSRLNYLLHIMIGHHGFWSLTPIWLFSLCAAIVLCLQTDKFWQPLARLTLALTLILIGFYIFRPIQDRNYGGVASGFRWMFWLIPLYSLLLIQALHSARRSVLIGTIFVLTLLVSIYSAHVAFLNPWQNPWPY